MGVILDAEDSTVSLLEIRDFRPIEVRSFPVEVGQAYALRVFVDGPFVEVYVDDVLTINAVRYALPTGGFGVVRRTRGRTLQ